MRVLHVVALIDAAGTYGGPTRVAMQQCTGLSTRGHQVTLLAGWDGRRRPETSFELRLFRARPLLRHRFATLLSVRLLLWALWHVADYDVVHLHLARDALTLPVGVLIRLRRVRYVVQTHGMVMPDTRGTVRLADAVAVQPVLRSAWRVLALTPTERDGLVSLGVSPGAVIVVPNGIVPADVRARRSDTSPRVVFVSRLADRKRPVAFVEAAARAHVRRPQARFELWGPDEGQLPAVRQAIHEHRLEGVVFYQGPAEPDDVLRLLAGAQVFVLPSYAEPFAMCILEAMSVGLPSVITHETGMSAVCGSTGAALVCDGSPAELAKAIDALLADEELWYRVAQAGARLVAERFTVDRVVDDLEGAYAGKTPAVEPARASGGSRPAVIDLSAAPGAGEKWDAPAWRVYAWGIVELLLVSNPWQISSRLRRAALVAFGARIGSGVLLRPRLRVRFPWKLTIGDHSWIGEDVWFHNQDHLTIGSDVVISQGTFITTGSHALRRDMALITKPVVVEDGAWVTARCIILGGSHVGVSAVVTPGTVVNGEVPAGMVFGPEPGRVLGPRFPARAR